MAITTGPSRGSPTTLGQFGLFNPSSIYLFYFLVFQSAAIWGGSAMAHHQDLPDFVK
jgi:hypothetical protein